MNPAPSASPVRVRRWLLLGGLWLFIAAVLLTFRGLVLPFAVAALIAYVLAPVLGRLTRLELGGRHLPRWGAILIVYATFFLALYLFVVGIVPQLYREIAKVTRDALEFANALTPERIQALAHTWEEWLTEHGVPVSLSSRALEGEDGGQPGAWSLALDLERAIRESALRFSHGLKENLPGIVAVSRNILLGVAAAVFSVFFILMVAAFISIDAEKIRGYGRSLIPPELAEDAKLLIVRIDRSLSGVVRGQLTICVVNGVLTFVGLLVFGVKFAFLLATLATFFSLIPIFGTVISSFPIVLIALTQSWKKALGMLLWIIGIHALEAYFLNPKIMGSAAKIHPVVIAFALLAGERTYGLTGALFAAPLAAILVACFEFMRLKAQPPVSPETAPTPATVTPPAT